MKSKIAFFARGNFTEGYIASTYFDAIVASYIFQFNFSHFFICDSWTCIINPILLQYVCQTQVTHLCQSSWEIISRITSLVGKSSLLVNFLWSLVKSLGVGIDFRFNDSLMCSTSFWYILNPIASTNNFGTPKSFATFSLSISLSDCLRCYYTIFVYFLFLVLLKLLVLSVGKITISLYSKPCRSLFISWYFYSFSIISVPHPIDKSSISNWFKTQLSKIGGQNRVWE